MSTQTLLTVEQFARMNTAETEDFELVEGELVPLPSGTLAHGWIRDEIRAVLGLYLRSSRRGVVVAEVDCRLSQFTVRRPDVSFFLAGRPVPEDEVPIPFAPDIAVEVLSPSEAAIDVNRKVLDYLKAGAREVWVVDRENGEVFVSTSEGIRLVRGDETLTTPLLPGFELALAELFTRAAVKS